LPPKKGYKIVKKTKYTKDEKGYLVGEDYDEYEEMPASAPVNQGSDKKEVVKKTIEKSGEKVKQPPQKQATLMGFAKKVSGPAQI
tara:strand:- start:171 stop:425 length:255 start_codon:yes stop_codon:yes gene_type:complete